MGGREGKYSFPKKAFLSISNTGGLLLNAGKKSPATLISLYYLPYYIVHIYIIYIIYTIYIIILYYIVSIIYTIILFITFSSAFVSPYIL